MPPTRPLKVFLCHASADKLVVRKLYRYLRTKGIKPWLDAENLLPGENWKEEIPKALFSSDVILVCISRNSINKEGYVQKEIAFALDKASEKPDGTIFIVPAKLEECDVPKRLNHLHWVDLYHEDGHRRLMLSLNKRAAQLGPAVEQAVISDETESEKMERETVAKADSQSVVVKEPSAQIEKPVESKQEKPKQEKPKQEKPKQEKPKQEKPKQEKPKQEKPKQEKPKQEKPKQIIQKLKTFKKTIIGVVGLVIFVLAAIFSFPYLIGKPRTYETTVPIVLCTPDSPIVNVYKAALQPWANTIFESAFPPSLPPVQFDEQKILSARSAAFQQLVNETKRWSDTQTINLEDSSEVSITLTYISPEMLQAALLNEVLKNRFPTYGFEDQLQKVLNTVAARDELLFLLTMTTTNDSVDPIRHTIKIPLISMVLHNAENLTITRSHDDHVLELLMDTTSDPVFEFLYYPLSSISEIQCKGVLDPKYQTDIALTLPYIEVDGVSNERPVSWKIPYVFLINPYVPTNTPVWNLPAEYDPSLTPMTPLTLPPIGMNRTNNWQDFARFVWGQLRLGKY